LNTSARQLALVICFAVLSFTLSISAIAQSSDCCESIGDVSIRRAVVHDFTVFQESYVTALDFAPDSQSLACGLHDGRVLLFDLPNARIIRELPAHDAAATSVNFSPDGRWVASSGEDGRAVITDLVDDSNSFQIPHSGVVHEIEFSPKGTYLMTVGEEQRVRIWDTSTWEEEESIYGHSGPILALAISPAEDLVVTGSGEIDPSIRLWDVASREQIQNDLYEGTVNDIEYSPRSSDHHVTIGSSQRIATIWDVDEGSMLHIIGPLLGGVPDVAYSSLGNTLVAVTGDGTLFFTTMPWWTEKRRIAFDSPLTAVAFSSSRQYIACSDNAGHIFLLYIPE
jgi:hypothetical protein